MLRPVNAARIVAHQQIVHGVLADRVDMRARDADIAQPVRPRASERSRLSITNMTVADDMLP